MKKSIVIAFLLLATLSIQAEETYTPEKNCRISLTAMSMTTSHVPGFLLGVSFEVFPKKWFSIENSLMLGASGGDFIFHTNAGFWGFKMLMENMKDEDVEDIWDIEEPEALALVLLVIIPNRINFFIDYGKNIYLVPFISPLGYDMIGDVESLSSGAGMKIDFRFEKFSIVPTVGVKYLYKLEKPSYFLGLSCGISF